MNQEILEAIKKALPSIQVDFLKEELAKAEKLKSVQMLLDDAQNKIKELSNKIVTLNAEISSLNLLVKKEKDLKDIEEKFEVEKLKYQLQCEKEKLKSIENLTHTVFKNPRIVRTKAVPVQGAHGAGGYVGSGFESEDIE